MHRFARLVCGSMLAFGIASSALADRLPEDLLVPAAKVDAGLGELPPVSEWREPWLHAIPSEKIDSGLGELPPVSEWREPWLHAMPAEKIDSGLGELAVRVAAQPARAQ
jgi:hypothetical protein